LNKLRVLILFCSSCFLPPTPKNITPYWNHLGTIDYMTTLGFPFPFFETSTQAERTLCHPHVTKHPLVHNPLEIHYNSILMNHTWGTKVNWPPHIGIMIKSPKTHLNGHIRPQKL
jgi:hypothetical protein